MYLSSVWPRRGVVIFLLIVSHAPGAIAGDELTLAHAERVALEHAPWLAHHRAFWTTRLANLATLLASRPRRTE